MLLAQTLLSTQVVNLQFGALLEIQAVLEEKSLLTPMAGWGELAEAVFRAKTQAKLTALVHTILALLQKILLHMILRINAKFKPHMELEFLDQSQSILKLLALRKNLLLKFMHTSKTILILDFQT